MRVGRSIRRSAVLLALVVAAVASGVALGSTPAVAVANAPSIPVPAADPFYTPPSGYAAQPNGAVLRSRPITATALGVALGVNAWQILYRSTDSHGHATDEAVTVMVPRTPWRGSGPRPVVSYQTAEDSVGTACEPSYVIRSGLGGISSNAAPEVTLMETMLLKGWAVISADYEGPDSQFIAAGQEAHGVLDGIRAAFAYAPDGLDRSHPLALWGYSGGAFATAWATQIAARYAPGLRFAGIAMGGVPSEAAPAMSVIDGSYGSGLVFGAMIGLQRAYPSAFTGLFNAKWNQVLSAHGSDCTDPLLLAFAFQHLSAYTTTPHPFAAPALAKLLTMISPVGHGAPSAPVYDYHTDYDEFVPVGTDDALVGQYCRAGVPVETVRDGYGEHNTTLLTGSAGAEVYLADRFAGQAPVNDCP